MDIQEFYENSVSAETDPLDTVTETASSGMVILAERVERLMRLCESLAQENQDLRQQCATLHVEYDELLAKNDQLRTRVDAMVVRLRSLE